MWILEWLLGFYVSNMEEKSPIVAGILSLFIPGLGQIYNGQVGKGFLCIVLTVILFILIFLLIGILLYPIWILLCAYDAYKTAQIINEGDEPPFIPF